MKNLVAKLKALVACAVVLTALRGLASFDYAGYAIGEDPAAVLVTFASGADSRGFAWFAATTVGDGAVWILPGEHDVSDDALFDSQGKKIVATCETRQNATTDTQPIHVFRARAYDLADGAYSYRLGCAGHYAYGRFTVGVSETVTIVNLNDAQTKEAPMLYMWENSCKAAAAYVGGKDKIDFVIDGGDHDDGRFFNAGPTNTCSSSWPYVNVYTQWAIANEAANQYLRDATWLMTSGNHDYMNSYLSVAEDFAVTQDFGGLKGCHSVDYGRVHVATLPWSNIWSGGEEKTVAWLEQDLAACRTRRQTDWIIVSTHAGPYTTGDNMRYDLGRSKAITNYIQRLSSVCSKYHVDLVVQAHDHTYSKTRPYRWDARGWTTNANDSAVVSFAPKKASVDGEVWDVNPRGTYYVSAGCAGHRVNELSEYADLDGAKTYAKRPLRIETGTVNVDSAFSKAGDDASKDVGVSMFGVIRIKGKRLSYDFLTVDANGAATLYDTLRVLKRDEGLVVVIADGR